jgi:hypothetical protein
VLGQVADRVLEAYRGFDLARADWFDSVNRASQQEFRARATANALELKREMDRPALERTRRHRFYSSSKKFTFK